MHFLGDESLVKARRAMTPGRRAGINGALLAAGLAAGLAVGFPFAGPAEVVSSGLTNLFPGITCFSEVRREPPMRLHIARVDLTNPRVHLKVSPGGPDPDGPRQWQTTLMRPTEIAAREGFDLVVNGDFFEARSTKDAEGTNFSYRAAIWASVNGPAVTDGKVWSTTISGRPCLVVRRDGQVSLDPQHIPAPGDYEVVAGNTMLVTNGVAVPHASKTRHPRTAVGLDAKHARLTILVVDGRKPGVALGMSYDELAAEFRRLGCSDALNLDGGGSSVLAVRDRSTGAYRLLNEPTDGRERPVANALGVTVASGGVNELQRGKNAKSSR